MIQALIFDFDGLILDTETCEYQAWAEVFVQHNCEMPRSVWEEHIGTHSTLDPYAMLAELSGKSIDRAAIRKAWHDCFSAFMAKQEVRPGVLDYLAEAKRRNLKVGIASSSHRAWISGYIEEHRIQHYFDTIKCRDDEDVGVAKPDPRVYRQALAALGVRPEQAIAFEDSVNGMKAAKAAGLFCVVIPNPMTCGFDFDGADLRLDSLRDMPLGQLLQLVNGKVRTN